LIINGWEILFFRLFFEIYVKLVREVEALREKDPDGYKSHRNTKLLASVQKSIIQDVPADPLHKKFMLSKSLDKTYKEWRRVKKGLPPRYRMFFRFHTKYKNVIFVWLNHEGCLRKKGDKHDVYSVFQKMLDRSEIPPDYKDLMASSITPHLH